MTTDEDITLRTILDHIQSFKMEMRGFQKEVRAEFLKVHARIDGVEGQLTVFQRRTEHRFDLSMMQIDSIDRRLDSLEIEEFPKKLLSHDRRIRRLEKKTGLTTAR